MVMSQVLFNLTSRLFKSITCETSCRSCGSSDAQSSKRLQSKNLSENLGNRSGGPDDLLSIRTGPPKTTKGVFCLSVEIKQITV